MSKYSRFHSMQPVAKPARLSTSLPRADSHQSLKDGDNFPTVKLNLRSGIFRRQIEGQQQIFHASSRSLYMKKAPPAGMPTGLRLGETMTREDSRRFTRLVLSCCFALTKINRDASKSSPSCKKISSYGIRN